jgi:hypothetical protein
MYGYGYRYNSGLVLGAGGGAPFANTKSLLFDGIDDYIELGSISHLQNATEYSISSWFKSPLNNQYQVIWGWADGADGYLQLLLVDDGSFVVYNYRISQAYGLSSTGVVSADTWYNATVIFDGGGATNADRLKLYINGSLITLTYTGTIPTQTGTMLNKTMWLGASNSFNFWGWEGNIDEVSIFDSAISIGDVWDGSGQPTDLSLLSTPPTNWYRMGDNGAYKSPQWLLPNNENKNKVSNYSFELDGVDNYVDCGNSAALKPNIITVSCWIKGSANSAFTRIISQDGPTGGADAYGFYVTTATNKIVFAIKTNTTGTVTSATSGVVLDNNWHHLVGTYDGSEVILYVDGIAVGSPSAGTSVLSYGSGTLTIGCFSEPTSLPSYLFNGNIDEVAIFDSVIPIGDLWDGSGQPTDLSLLPTPPVAWYKMGEEATFSGGLWTVPDNVGSNDGTSNAMTIEDRVGEAPSSENNALSYNMDLVDRVTDVP